MTNRCRHQGLDFIELIEGRDKDKSGLWTWDFLSDSDFVYCKVSLAAYYACYF